MMPLDIGQTSATGSGSRDLTCVAKKDPPAMALPLPSNSFFRLTEINKFQVKTRETERFRGFRISMMPVMKSSADNRPCEPIECFENRQTKDD